MPSLLHRMMESFCKWSTLKGKNLFLEEHILSFKGRFLLFQVYSNFANLFFKLSVSTFYKEISKFQQKVQS